MKKKIVSPTHVFESLLKTRKSNSCKNNIILIRIRCMFNCSMACNVVTSSLDYMSLSSVEPEVWVAISTLRNDGLKPI